MYDNLPKTKKSLGQHWLTDQSCLTAIADAAQVNSQDVVLEIGPGAGTLTRVLCERARQVTAVEFDEQLAADLQRDAEPWKQNLTVVQQDILRFDLTTMPAGYKVVANIPYYLTSNLIRILSESSNSPQIAVLLVQKEVAERVAAVPGNMSVLSVTAQYYWHVALGREVLARLFTPPPQVDSQVLVLARREQPLFENIDTRAFFRLVKIGYSQRRKTILNTLSSGYHLGKGEVRELCERADVAADARAQTLDLPAWYRLYCAIQATSVRP